MALQPETYGQHRATLWNGVSKYLVLGTLSYQHYELTPLARAGIQSNLKKSALKSKLGKSPRDLNQRRKKAASTCLLGTTTKPPKGGKGGNYKTLGWLKYSNLAIGIL